MMKKLLYTILFLLLTKPVFAGANLDSGVFTVKYKEPTLSEDGSALDDLYYTTIYYKLNEGQKVIAKIIQAISANGGNIITETFSINDLGSQVNVTISYTATDFSGNESEEFIEPTIRIDQVAPAMPEGVSS